MSTDSEDRRSQACPKGDASLYDDAALYDLISPGLPHDVEFYRQAAIESGGPVLELACGTGRVLHGLIETGLELWGVDRSPAMLGAARRKLEGKAHLVEGDMRAFTLPQTFSLVIVAYRSFQHLLTVRAQRQALRCIGQHLAPGGRLILDLFDPRMEAPGDPFGEPMRYVMAHATEHGRILVFKTRTLEPARQRLQENWIFDDVAPDGSVAGRRTHTLELRYSYRWEMYHLLRRSGFRPRHLFGDFKRGPWRPGREQVWMADYTRKGPSGKEAAGHADHDMP